MLTLEETQISIKEWEAMTALEQLAYVRLLERSDYELDTLLHMVECPDHGPCIPYFRDWVRKQLDAESAAP